MLHRIPAYQEVSPIHSNQLIIVLSFPHSPVPVLRGAALPKLAGHHQLHPMLMTRVTLRALFLIAI